MKVVETHIEIQKVEADHALLIGDDVWIVGVATAQIKKHFCSLKTVESYSVLVGCWNGKDADGLNRWWVGNEGAKCIRPALEGLAPRNQEGEKEEYHYVGEAHQLGARICADLRAAYRGGTVLTRRLR